MVRIIFMMELYNSRVITMSKVSTLFAGIMLISLCADAGATVIIHNDWLHATMDVYSEAMDGSVYDSVHDSYTGAATTLNWSDGISTYAAIARRSFAIGKDVMNTNYQGHNTLFSGRLLTDDIWSGKASAYLETFWVFTTTEEITYDLRMVGEGNAPLSFYLYDETINMVVSEGRDTSVISRLIDYGILQSYHTYSLRMIVDRYKDYTIVDHIGDGVSDFRFGLSDTFVLADSRTHNSVTEPSVLILLSAGLAGLAFSRKQRLFS
jgi:hypothetical protein